MIAVDTNLLVYAHRRETPFHQEAKTAIAELAERGQRWGIPVHCLHEFYAITSNARIFSPPSTPEQVVSQIEAWLESPHCHVLHGSQQHWRILQTLALNGKVTGGQIHDARIAATCLENGVIELWTADRDFSKFPALKAHNPLVRTGMARLGWVG